MPNTELDASLMGDLDAVFGRFGPEMYRTSCSLGFSPDVGTEGPSLVTRGRGPVR